MGRFQFSFEFSCLLFWGDLNMFVIWHEKSEEKECPNESLDVMEEDHAGDRQVRG